MRTAVLFGLPNPQSIRQCPSKKKSIPSAVYHRLIEIKRVSKIAQWNVAEAALHPLPVVSAGLARTAGSLAANRPGSRPIHANSFLTTVPHPVLRHADSDEAGIGITRL